MRKGLFIATSATLLSGLLMSAAVAQTTAPPSADIHGYIQNRFYANPESTARFAVYRLSLQASAKLADNRTAYAELYYQPWVTDAVVNSKSMDQSRFYLESAYMDTPFADGSLRIGKGRQLNFGMTPTVGNRKSTEYNILAETFTQDRIQGFQYSRKQGVYDGGISLYADQRIGYKKLGDTPGLDGNATVKHFSDKDDNANLSGRLAVAAKCGFSGPCWKLHASGAIGGLVQDDADVVGAAYGIDTTNKTHTKYGVDSQWAKGEFVSSGEYYVGQDSFLTIRGYSFMVGLEPKIGPRAYLRYSALDNNRTPTANQLTWDTQQLIASVIQPIGKGVWAELEYVRNTESPNAGTKDVDNDLLFLEVFTGF